MAGTWVALVTVVVFIADAECQGGYDRRRFQQASADAVHRQVNPLDIRVSLEQSYPQRSRSLGRSRASVTSRGRSSGDEEDGGALVARSQASSAPVPVAEGVDRSGLSAFDSILQGQGHLRSPVAGPVRQGSLAIGLRDRWRQRLRYRWRDPSRRRSGGRGRKKGRRGRQRRLWGRTDVSTSASASARQEPESRETGEQEASPTDTRGQSGEDRDAATSTASREDAGETGETTGASPTRRQPQNPSREGQGEGQRREQGQGQGGGETTLLSVEGPLGPAFVTARTAHDYLSSSSRSRLARTNERRSESNQMGFGIGEDLCELFGKHLVRTNIGGRCE